MAHRIEIGLRAGVFDARGAGVVRRARKFLGLPVISCRTRDAYKIAVDLRPRELARLRRALTDPVIARSAAGRLPPPRFDWLIEVGFKPGVTDNVGRTACVVIEDLLGRRLRAGETVYTSVQYFLRGRGLVREDARRVAYELLANPLIHTVEIWDPTEWAAAPVDATVPPPAAPAEGRVRIYDLSGSDEDLLRLSREGILSLSLEEMRAIRDYFARPEVRAARREVGLPEQPTDVDLECLAQTWSEHCKHKIFNARVRYVDEAGREEWIESLFRTYVRGTTEKVRDRVDWLVSVFSDNAGVIRFNERVYLVAKVETHNTPCALDPYAGAITGIVGVNRDPMGTGLGAEMLGNLWGYCLASPFYRGEVPAGLFHPRRLREGVHQGVIDGGNQSGIPYLRGFERFDDRYLGKPLVYCGTLGVLPARIRGVPSERKDVRPGDRVVMVGGRIGKDGIHGATFSSEELRQESPPQAVQIGDPITQRKMYDFLMEARDRGLYRALTDNGAGGLSSSVGEMGRLSGGADIDVALAPLKYEGLEPWEILLSEAQERMTLAVPPEHVDELLDLARRRDVEATVLGSFTDSGQFVVRYRGRVVGRLDMSFLHDGCPVMTLEARWTPPVVPPPRRPRAGRRNAALRSLLGRLNVCSKAYRARMYDHEVKGRTVVKPLVGVHGDIPSDATVVRVELGSCEGLAVAEGINPYYSDLDTYAMAASVVDEAVRRLVSVGARLGTIAGLDNFCWPDPVLSERTPDGPYKMAQLVRANRGLYDVATAYGVPLISGKDSMKNDSVRGGRKISVPPTLLFTALGKLDDVRRAVTPYVKKPGDLVYVVGLTREELGASEYYRWLAEVQGRPEAFGGRPPSVDPPSALALYRALETAHREGLLRSSHTPTLGGLAVAFALAALGGGWGLELDLAAVPRAERLSDDALLFSESNSRFVITSSPDRAEALEGIFAGLPCARVGRVTETQRLVIRGAHGRLLVDETLDDLHRAYRKTLEGI